RRLLVRPAAGLPALRLRPPSPRAGRPRHARRRRHGREPPRPPRLRQGPPPRPGPLLPLLHGLALRPQMGRPGGAGPPPLRLPPLGPPRADRPVPVRAGRPRPAAAAPHPGPADVPAAAAGAAALPPPPVPL